MIILQSEGSLPFDGSTLLDLFGPNVSDNVGGQPGWALLLDGPAYPVGG
jgi:hypothetical protein